MDVASTKVLHPFEMYNDYMNWDTDTRLSRQKSLLAAETDRLSHMMLAHQKLDKERQQRVNEVLTCAKQLISLVYKSTVVRPTVISRHLI